MAGRIRGPGRGWWWIGCLVLSVTLWPQEGAAQSAAADATGRLRPADKKAAALLAAGIARSETFRLLVDVIERSDLVVYVETGVMAVPGQLQFAIATPGTRYLRVSIRVPGLENDLLPWLAHELCHATEIAEAREVNDQASMETFTSGSAGASEPGRGWSWKPPGHRVFRPGSSARSAGPARVGRRRSSGPGSRYDGAFPCRSRVSAFIAARPALATSRLRKRRKKATEKPTATGSPSAPKITA